MPKVLTIRYTIEKLLHMVLKSTKIEMDDELSIIVFNIIWSLYCVLGGEGGG
jgi:hypothetical protein